MSSAKQQEKSKKLAFALAEWLSGEGKTAASALTGSDAAESIDIAVQCISEAFGLGDLSDPNTKAAYSIAPSNLGAVFDVFLATQAKVKGKEATSAPAAPVIDKVAAEAAKAKANKEMAAKNYEAAITLYSEAITFDNTNAVYFANRAAAYSQSGRHDAAVTDSKAALDIDSSYSKAYSRLGHAQFCLGNFNESVQAYESGLALDPDNAAMRQALATAQARAESSLDPSTQLKAPAAANGAPSAIPGMPNMPAGMDLGSMLSDPNFMSMAQKMMSNPAFSGMAQKMMSDPNALSNLMSNPDLMKMAGSMMGGTGKKP